MPGERLSMRKIREVLRLRLGHKLPQRAVAQSLRLSQGAISGYLGRARRAGLSWPLPEGLDDEQLEALLFPPPPAVAPDQRPVPDWIAAHVNALTSLGGVPRQIVSDNLKAGITKACFYEPTVNRTYAAMAAHYGTTIIPARPYKPRDTDEVEQCLLRDRPACRA